MGHIVGGGGAGSGVNIDIALGKSGLIYDVLTAEIFDDRKASDNCHKNCNAGGRSDNGFHLARNPAVFAYNFGTADVCHDILGKFFGRFYQIIGNSI